MKVKVLRGGVKRTVKVLRGGASQKEDKDGAGGKGCQKERKVVDWGIKSNLNVLRGEGE